MSPAPEVPHQVVTARLLVLLSEMLRPWPDILVAIAVLATWLPARRAIGLDPIRTLKAY